MHVHFIIIIYFFKGLLYIQAHLGQRKFFKIKREKDVESFSPYAKIGKEIIIIIPKTTVKYVNEL